MSAKTEFLLDSVRGILLFLKSVGLLIAFYKIKCSQAAVSEQL